MPRDPIRLADAKAWLAKADMDLKAAAHELTAAPPFTADAVFHAQQAAEKAMKGFLAWHDLPFRKTHDLAEIGHQCASLDPSLEPLLMRAASLTQYAWKFRYPGEPEEPSREVAEISIALAREVHAAIVSLLPQEFDLT
jgi:HEPN domain-containing protein